MSPFLAVLCAVLVVVLVYGEKAELPVVRAISKTGAAACFIAFGLAMGALDRGTPGLWVVAGLVFCMGGDLFLLSRARHWFLAGLVSFLIGHVCYVGAFLSLGVAPMGAAGGAVAVLVVAAGIWSWLGSKVDDKMRGPVLAYIAVISVMVTCSIGVLVASPGPAQGVLVAAACAFFVSDICVARDRFVSPGFDNRLVGLPLYFGAQLLFGLGIGLVG